MCKIRLLFRLGFLAGMLFFPCDGFAQKRKRAEPQSATTRLQEAEYYFAEGEKHFILQDYAKALLYFQRVAELNPVNPTVHFKIAEVFAKSGRPEDLQQAILSVERALALEKKNKHFYALASQLHAQQGNYSRAAVWLEALLKENPGAHEYWFELAALYRVMNQPDDALRTYQRAEQALGISDVSSFQKIQLYLESRKLAEAEREYKALMEHFPDEERYASGMADLLARTGYRVQAIALIEDFMKTHPKATGIRVLLAGLYRDAGKEEQSRALALSLISQPEVALSNKLAMVSTYHAQLAQQRGAGKQDPSLEKMVADMARQLQTQYPADSEAALMSARIWLLLNDRGKARACLHAAIDAGTMEYEAWQTLLVLEAETGRFDSLLTVSERCLELFPNQGLIYYFNGYARLRKGQPEEAAGMLEQALKLSRSDANLTAEINGMLGDAYQETGEYAKSNQAYEAALKIQPHNDVLLNNYAYYLSLRGENLEQAEKMAAAVIKRNPHNATYLDTYGWVLYARGKYKEARKALEQAIEAGSTSAVIFDHYGDILFQLGEVEKAVQQWQRAAALDPSDNRIQKKINTRRNN